MLSEKQRQIVETDKQKVIVLASAASGKTNTMIERVKYLLENNISPNKIVVITFTNNAAQELLKRLGDQAKGIYCMTIHSYANNLLLSHNIDTREFLNKEDFNSLFKLVKNNPQCIKEVDHLLLDEAQDSTLEQFEFLLNVIKPKNWMLVGDWRQCIYKFNGACPEYLIDLSKQSDVFSYELNENYRNSKRILEFSQSLIQQAGQEYIDNSIPMRNIDGRVIIMEYSTENIVKILKKYKDYENWFILTRTNQEKDYFCNILKKYDVPYDSFSRSELNENQLNERLKAKKVKVLTIHNAKGLESLKVVVIGARLYDLDEKCISYVAATRAKNLLVWTRPKRTYKKRNNSIFSE